MHSNKSLKAIYMQLWKRFKITFIFFNKCLLRGYYVPGTCLGIGVNESSTVPAHGVYIPEGVVGRIMAPQDVHVLITTICECVTLHGKRDFADLTKLSILRSGNYFGLPRFLVTTVTVRGKREAVRERKDVTTEAEVRVM